MNAELELEIPEATPVAFAFPLTDVSDDVASEEDVYSMDRFRRDGTVSASSDCFRWPSTSRIFKGEAELDADDDALSCLEGAGDADRWLGIPNEC